jgi:hypothetical protein
MEDIIVKEILQMPITNYEASHHLPMFITFEQIVTESDEILEKLYIRFIFPQLDSDHSYTEDFGLNVFKCIKKLGCDQFSYTNMDLLEVIKTYDTLNPFNKQIVNIPVKGHTKFKISMSEFENAYLELETRPLKQSYDGPALKFHPRISLMAHFIKK